LIIIGVTGKAGAGKDTIADRLVARHSFKKMSFAGPLKEVLYKMDPIIGMDPMRPGWTLKLQEALDRMTEDTVKALFPEYRRLLQKLGTEGIRAIDEQFWIKAAAKMIMAEANDARLVFTDCRFPNEAQAIQRAGMRGNVLPLPGPTAELWCVTSTRPRKDETVAPHSSEDHVGNMGEDYFIDNNSGHDVLYAAVDDLARDLIEVESVKLAGG
jgi:hypothetical protein